MTKFFSNLIKKNSLLSPAELVSKKTFISFSFFFLLVAAGVFGWIWLKNQPLDQGLLGGVQEPVRKVLDKNGELSGKLFNKNKLAKTYQKKEAVKNVRVNGDLGMDADFDPATWKLQVVRSAGDTLFITLDELKKLPKTEIVFDFKCIEGWSQITHWGGVKFKDFIKKYGLSKESKMNYVGLITPDEAYYVGIDMPSAMHEQTLLCYEMNGKELPADQGYPLRLIITVKYGIKSLKRIGSIYFENSRPKDYWFERGYDYHSGL